MTQPGGIMTDKEARIMAIKYLWVSYTLLADVYQFGHRNKLTDDTNELRKSIENLSKQIKTHVVEIGLGNGNNWEHPEWILDIDKFQKDFGKYFGTFEKSILLEVIKIIDSQPEINTEEDTL